MYRILFDGLDRFRCARGRLFDTIGLGPTECPYRVVAEGPFWRLRDYGQESADRTLCIVAAPIKRSYIWDLAPSFSTIRYCLAQGIHVQLVEWLPASQATGNNGLYEYAGVIGESVASRASRKTFLIGHSLGGTLAAVYAALRPSSIDGLVLLDVPLCFRPGMSRFWDALWSASPSTLSDAEPYPGSLISMMSMLASPQTFIWARLRDATSSLTDRRAFEVHARVERWTLDEAALPGRLVREVIETVCRENSFCRGQLEIGGISIGPGSMAVPMLVVINRNDEVAPPESIMPFIHAMPTGDARIIEYPGEIGISLQHVGVLVGDLARAQVWPAIIEWISAHARRLPQGSTARVTSNGGRHGLSAHAWRPSGDVARR